MQNALHRAQGQRDRKHFNTGFHTYTGCPVQIYYLYRLSLLNKIRINLFLFNINLSTN